MNSDQFEGKWKQLKGSVKQHWGKLTDDDVTMLSGKKDELIGRIQERYGITREEAEKQTNEFAKTYGTPVSEAEVNRAASRANAGRV
ncbi:MAG TPA: CsbD family protein [Bryobacteraceae bacterium]|jgi:uncharacterized protein YjbJ (UPF0337 family)|nr:CsbD family protein [Bryobacteraceae bacterium]